MADANADPSLAPGQDRLSCLPIEILVRITLELDTPELCALRQCSRSLEHALRYFFLHGFFRRRQFMLTELSLQTLLAFAQHPNISQTLRHVTIGIEEFCVALKDYPEDREQAIALTMAAADQKALVRNGRALRLLATAFSLLPNLETVQLRNLDMDLRLGAEPQDSEDSYGLRRTRAQLGVKADQLLLSSRDTDLCPQAFSLVVAALAQSKARPPNIEVEADVYGLNYLAFDLSPVPRLFVQDGSDGYGIDVHAYAVLAGLRRVFLKLQCGFHPLESEEVEYESLINTRARSSRAFAEYLPLYVWLAHCPKIQWLRLNLAEEACGYHSDFLKQLGTPLPASCSLPPASPASRNVTMPFASHLRRLDLGIACCDAEVLPRLLERLPALEHLSLWRFCLVYETRHPFTIWKDFLASFAKSSPGAQLKQLSLSKVGTVTYADYYPNMEKTHIATFNGLHSVEYIAKFEKSMASWLQNMVIHLKPQGSSGGAYDSEFDSVQSDENIDGTSSDMYDDGMSEYEIDIEHEGAEEDEESEVDE
ncbi:hypothetical protein SEPCBS119000_004574 [Sporothrix epigloea]|uniref:F-box domain-containing protein n=1 Tax=Sporothrix epigloea TaxID=1892477 RepID=A0ABP0DWV8_9PEZI